MTKQSFSIKSYVNKHLRNHLKKTKTQKDLANIACKVSSFSKNGGYLLSHGCAVPSARTGLTSLFGMGRGGTPTL